MAAVSLWLVGALVLPLLLWLWVRGAPARARLARCGEQIPGPRPLPFIGNALEFGLINDMSALVDKGMSWRKKYGSLLRLWVGPFFIVVLTDPRDIEVLLSSTKHIKKSFTYSFLHPWLGEGLLTSFGDRWHKHRKIITPTFHFKILEQFVDVFNKQGDILISKLKESDNEYLDTSSYIDLYTQDVICETAMGVELNAQTSRRATAYLNAVKHACEVITKRNLKLWIFPDILFQLSSYGRSFKKSITILHSFTNEVIENRKRLLQVHQNESNTDVANLIGKKKMPFLDLLLLSAQTGATLTDTDIREEVDTFMFEGHDTTASAINFALYELSRHPDIQEKIYTELKETQENKDIIQSINSLNGLKYLEQVIKETLRLYPSVPLFVREMTEELHLPHRNVVIPSGTWTAISPFMQHRDAEYFPSPEVFDPDNFSPEAIQKRHPFAYIPFSAGPRNCIGQKFAMLEIKSLLSKIIWNFHLKIDPDYKLKVVPELTLKWAQGIPISFTPRMKS